MANLLNAAERLSTRCAVYILRASDACVVASADCKLAANCLVIRAARGTLLLHIEKQVLTPSKGQMQLVCTGYMLFSHASVLDIYACLCVEKYAHIRK